MMASLSMARAAAPLLPSHLRILCHHSTGAKQVHLDIDLSRAWCHETCWFYCGKMVILPGDNGNLTPENGEWTRDAGDLIGFFSIPVEFMRI